MHLFFILEWTTSLDSSSRTLIDDIRGACAVKGNGAVAGHVKRVDHDDVFGALLFREETLTRHYFILKFHLSWGIRTNMGKTEGIFLNLQCNYHIVGSIIIKLITITVQFQYMAGRFDSANAAIQNGVSLARH